MVEKEAEEIEKEAVKWVKDVFPNDEFKQSGISRALVEFAELGYNKANEWHFVKDGDLPKHEVNVLVLYNVQCIDIAHYNYDYKEWHFIDSIVRDVIAWKEIVLPKEN